MIGRNWLGMLLFVGLVACGRDFEMPAAPLDPTVGGDGTCLVDGDCFGEDVCAGAADPIRGVCSASALDYVPNLGPFGALTLRDNLPALRAYLDLRVGPGLGEVVQINQVQIEADGTVDLGTGLAPSINYELRLDPVTGETISVQYRRHPGREGFAAGVVGEVPTNTAHTAITEADLSGYLTIPELFDAMAANPGCIPPSGRMADILTYVGDGTVRALISTDDGHAYVADPVTGQGFASCN